MQSFAGFPAAAVVAAQASPVDLEAEQFKPVLRRFKGQIAAVPREFATVVVKRRSSPHNDKGIEADNHDPSFGDQDAPTSRRIWCGSSLNLKNVA